MRRRNKHMFWHGQRFRFGFRFSSVCHKTAGKDQIWNLKFVFIFCCYSLFSFIVLFLLLSLLLFRRLFTHIAGHFCVWIQMRCFRNVSLDFFGPTNCQRFVRLSIYLKSSYYSCEYPMGGYIDFIACQSWYTSYILDLLIWFAFYSQYIISLLISFTVRMEG